MEPKISRLEKMARNQDRVMHSIEKDLNILWKDYQRRRASAFMVEGALIFAQLLQNYTFQVRQPHH